MDEQGPQQEEGAHNQEAWERYIEAERREIKMRREGHLARILGPALPGESPEELKRLAEEDRLRAKEGLVDLMDEHGQITHKHIDELAPEDQQARIRAEGARIEWIVESGRPGSLVRLAPVRWARRTDKGRPTWATSENSIKGSSGVAQRDEEVPDHDSNRHHERSHRREPQSPVRARQRSGDEAHCVEQTVVKRRLLRNPNPSRSRVR